MLFFAGQAPAQISVSSGGQASAGLPIALPPGIAGMNPNLSLSYADGGINGPVGVGWSVQGISVITRCPASRPLDGSYRGVMFDQNDKLCLDGQRLVQTDAAGAPINVVTSPARLNQSSDAQGLSGTAHREFRTEKESYSRIRAYGTAPAGAAFGPDRFVVWTKSGLKYEYGRIGTADRNAQILAEGSSHVAVWAVRRVSDVYGNFMLFDYEQRVVTSWGSATSDAGSREAREWNLRQILYTGRFSLSNPDSVLATPANRVVFSYEDRVGNPPLSQSHDRSEAYQFNSKNVSIQRLKGIFTYVGGPNTSNEKLVKHYKLTYQVSPRSGRSLLQSVAECSDLAGTRCLPPTTFAYRSIDEPKFTERSGFSLRGELLLDINNQAGVLTGDFDGDGRTDILRYHDDAALNKLFQSDGTGNFIERPSNITSQQLFHSNRCYYSTVADFNGDGLSDILRVVARNEPGCGGASGSNLVLLSAPTASAHNFTPAVVPAAAVLERTRYTEYYGPPGPCTLPYRGTAPGMSDPSSSSKAEEPIGTWFDGVPQQSSIPGKSSSGPKADASPLWGQCQTLTVSLGRYFYILDVDGDGLLDIVTALRPDMEWRFAGSPPTVEQICEGHWSAMEAQSSVFGQPCTRVFRGSASGVFTEVSSPVSTKILYRSPSPPAWNSNPYWVLPDIIDANGDGLMDIRADTGTWLSLGNGNFMPSGVAGVNLACGMPIDFNGDGRGDCIYPNSAAASQQLRIAYGPSWSNPITTFNLTSTPLTANDGQGRQTVGLVVEDFDGDGRQDILRWSSEAWGNQIYLSRGDGSFRSIGNANLGNMQIQRSDGARAFVLGDFMGVGSLQILRLAANPPASLAGGVSIACHRLNCNDPPPPPEGIRDTVYNMMLVRLGQIGPGDVLASVTTPGGLTTTVAERAVLTRGLNPETGSGYERDTDPPAPSADGRTAIINITPPTYVITAIDRDTGNGTLTTRFRYTGMKAERGGRGLLGFRRMQQQDTSPAGTPMRVVTDYLLTHPYSGVAWRTETFVKPDETSAEKLVSRTENTYCEYALRSSAGTAAPATPCTSASTFVPITRPYLAKTVEQGWELGTNAVLPVVVTTNTYNAWGDPLTIVSSTQNALVNPTVQYVRTTTNTFCEPDVSTCPRPIGTGTEASPNSIAGDTWILGRLTRSEVRSQSTDSMPSVSAGTAPNATAVKGSPPPGTPMAINPAVLQSIIDLILEE
jgi:hypothetical protein